jgi:energy-coupling factor transporter ATP-binding protein EcfA2
MKDYKVIMLGSSGSGKTVLLASMYKQLAIHGDAKFFLEVGSGENRKRLNSVYMQVATGETWPRGTRPSEISEWSFTCKVQTPNLSVYPACKFTYIDYPGGLITDESEDDASISSQLDDELADADAFLGLLDGQKILEMMKGQKGGDVLIYNDLPNMLPIMSQSGTENPVHFVISKWDLIENHFSLESIRERLLAIRDFKQLVQSRVQAGSQVRLIPVSSVGSGFAVPQPDGSMKKVVGHQPEAFQVEMPIACVLPAKFRLELSRLNEEKQEELSRKIEIKPNYTFWDNLRMFIADTIETVWEMLPENYQLGNKIFQRLINFAEEEPLRKKEEAERRTEELRQERDKTLRAVTDEETALEHVIASFLHIESTLDTRFPASNLKTAL